MDKSTIINMREAARAMGKTLMVITDNNYTFRDEGITKDGKSNSLVTWNDDAEIFTCVRTNTLNYQHNLPVEIVTGGYDVIQYLTLEVNPNDIQNILTSISIASDKAATITKALGGQVANIQHFQSTGDGINFKNTIARGASFSKNSNDVSPNATMTIKITKKDLEDTGLEELLGTPVVDSYGNLSFKGGSADVTVDDNGDLTINGVKPENVKIDDEGNLTFA